MIIVWTVEVKDTFTLFRNGGRGGETKILTDKSDVSHWFNHVTQAYIKKKHTDKFAQCRHDNRGTVCSHDQCIK